MLKKAWKTKEDVFEPFQIVPKAEVQYLIAALVSMEKIEVSWAKTLDRYQDRQFTTVSGVAVMAPFCVDETAREMSSLSFKGGKAVLLPCTPKQKKTRGMIFVLPEEKDMKLNACLEALAKHADGMDGQGRRQGLVFRNSKNDWTFSFPAFNAEKKPATIKTWLDKYVPELFKEDSQCMEGTLPENLIGGFAYVSDVQHGASIKANKEGAESRTLSLATVAKTRGGPTTRTEEFNCDRPFISILATLETDTDGFKVENVELVTKHETGKTLDLQAGTLKRMTALVSKEESTLKRMTALVSKEESMRPVLELLNPPTEEQNEAMLEMTTRDLVPEEDKRTAVQRLSAVVSGEKLQFGMSKHLNTSTLSRSAVTLDKTMVVGEYYYYLFHINKLDELRLIFPNTKEKENRDTGVQLRIPSDSRWKADDKWNDKLKRFVSQKYLAFNSPTCKPEKEVFFLVHTKGEIRNSIDSEHPPPDKELYELIGASDMKVFSPKHTDWLIDKMKLMSDEKLLGAFTFELLSYASLGRKV